MPQLASIATRSLPAFSSDGVRVFEPTQRLSADRVAPAPRWADDTLIFVQGGAAMVEHGHEPPSLVDPAHALLVSGDQEIRIRAEPASVRCTVITVVRAHATPELAVHDRLGTTARIIPLDAETLFRFYWLRRVLISAVPRPTHELTRVARAIHRDAMPFMRGAGSRRAERARGRSPWRTLATDARMRIAASVESAHPLADVARGLRVSPFHLAHVFRDDVGLSVHQYLLRLRLVTAMDRLSAGVAHLSTLALDLGFSNHSHFSKAFRASFGVSPTEARRRLAAATLSSEGFLGGDLTAHPHARCG